MDAAGNPRASLVARAVINVFDGVDLNLKDAWIRQECSLFFLFAAADFGPLIRSLGAFGFQTVLGVNMKRLREYPACKSFGPGGMGEDAGIAFG